MNLPAEILESIFSYLSQRYLARCSLVCRRWHLIGHPLLYRSISIYSKHQLLHFIEAVAVGENCCRPSDNNTISMASGKRVRHVLLYYTYYGFHNLDQATWRRLQRACPNVATLTCSKTTYANNRRQPFTPLWENITTLPYWHSEDMKQWYPYLGEKLTYFQISIFDIDDYRRVLQMLPLPPLNSLNELEVDSQVGLNGVLFERLLDGLQSSCPKLTTLTMRHIFPTSARPTATAAITDRYPDHTIPPVNTVTRLTIKQSIFSDTILFYTFLNQVLPNVQSLHLSLQWPSHRHWTPDIKHHHQKDLYSMLSNYSKNLRSLEIVAVTNEWLLEDFLPTNDMMMDWLACQQQLTTLAWPLPLIVDNPLFTTLTCVDLSLDDSLSDDDVLRYLLYISNNTSSSSKSSSIRDEIPRQLETLKLRHNYKLASSVPCHKYFHLDDWRQACPRLKHLHLYNANISNNSNSDNDGVEISAGNGNHFNRLTHLVMEGCHIMMEADGLTQIVRHCPSLVDLRLRYTFIQAKQDRLGLLQKLDASHLNLDCVYLRYNGVFYNGNVENRDYFAWPYLVEKNDPPFDLDATKLSSPTLLILCQSIDNLVVDASLFT